MCGGFQMQRKREIKKEEREGGKEGRQKERWKEGKTYKVGKRKNKKDSTGNKILLT